MAPVHPSPDATLLVPHVSEERFGASIMMMRTVHLGFLSCRFIGRGGTLDADIAVLRVRNARTGAGIVFGDEVQPICLPSGGLSIPSGTECVISGWRLSDSGDMSGPHRFLRDGRVQIVADEDCSEKIEYTNLAGKLCAGDGPNSPCMGDSGSPLVCSVDGRETVVGLVSFSVGGCGRKGIPSIYTKVADYRSWIESSIVAMEHSARQRKK